MLIDRACHWRSVALIIAPVTSLVFIQCSRMSAEISSVRRASLSAEELRSELLKSQQRLASFYVVYESDDYDQSLFPEGYFLRRVVAAKSPDSLFHWTAHGHGALAWEDDVNQQRARMYGGHLYNEFVANRAYFETVVDVKKNGLPGTLSNEFLFSVVGYWPLTGIKPPRLMGDPYVLREVALSEKYNQVRPQLEQVNNRWCHILEWAGRDRLWLDIERGCALMARETHSPITGRLAQRIDLGNYRELRPGIWFPMRITNIQFDHNATDVRKQARVWKRARHDVLEVRINDVEDSVFQWIPPPGAIRVFDGASPQQTVSGGIDHLDDVASWVRRNLQMSEHTLARAHPIAVVAVASVLLIGVFEILRMLQRRKITSNRCCPVTNRTISVR